MMSLQQIITDFIDSIAEAFTTLPDNFLDVLKNPLTILTLIGFLIILTLLIKAKNIKFSARMITHIGIALALTSILDMLKIYKFPQGGGVTLASMVPILIISYMYGPLVGMLTGFANGILSLLMGPYILHPVQVLFDYPLPYLALGVAGFFRNKKLLGATVAIFLRFIFHFISGVVFFGSSAPEGVAPWIYSLSVNGTLLGIDGLICIIVLALLPLSKLVNVTRNQSSLSS